MILADLAPPPLGAAAGIAAIGLMLFLNRRPPGWWEPRHGDQPPADPAPPAPPTPPEPPMPHVRITRPGRPQLPAPAAPGRPAMPPREHLSPEYRAYLDSWRWQLRRRWWFWVHRWWAGGRCELGITRGCNGRRRQRATEADHKHYRTLFHERRRDVGLVCHNCHVRREELKDRGVNIWEAVTPPLRPAIIGVALLAVLVVVAVLLDQAGGHP
jgi:hypothetical protein